MIVERAAEVAAGRAVVLRQRILQIAIRDEIAVIGPRAIGRLRERRCRVGPDVDAVIGRVLPVFRQVQLNATDRAAIPISRRRSGSKGACFWDWSQPDRKQ